jgi:hypothetical protein
MIDRAVGIAGLAVSIASLVLPSLFPAINRKIAWGGLACGFLGRLPDRPFPRQKRNRHQRHKRLLSIKGQRALILSVNGAALRQEQSIGP